LTDSRDMSAHRGAIQNSGFQTSVDIARQQPFAVAPLAGQKRPPSGSLNEDTDNPSPHAINGTSRQNLPNGQGLDFSRPQVHLPKSRLIASEICTVAGSENEQKPRPDDPSKSQGSLQSLNDPRFGLTPALVANFAAVGVTSIYQWQASCLLGEGLLEGKRHLIYTAPTGGGKSLVADVLMLKRIIENPTRKAILVLPYVALVQEKLKWLRRIIQDVEKHTVDDENPDPSHHRWRRMQKSIRISGFFGGSKTTASWADTDIAVCTIEKVCRHEGRTGMTRSDIPRRTR
jgi:DNA polymerase theta